ncbi:glycosyltransferase [Cellulomonas endophytica]|uniref:glycosyltransferase n=1 Tax=Cellulomonas endophytica TaxID=2494735 RepID=UPI001012333C|nr:glycosyltransferase [Cellulomonas endophytica]
MTGGPRYAHLRRLSTGTGLYEHALGTSPRVEHGMCVDDVARALVVTVRAGDPGLADLSTIYLSFLLDALRPDGRMHNRRTPEGVWVDRPSTDDHWGRAVWAFGTTVAAGGDPGLVARARAGASTAVQARSPHPRATAYAALGAVQLVRALPADLPARRLVHDARASLPRVRGGAWPWPDERLTYANAVLPEAMIAVGHTLHDARLRDDGLVLLGWLEDEQTVEDYLSVVPAGGRVRGDGRPAFDQQSIEVAALAEAARTAHRVTGDRRWVRLLARCEAWFTGDNDCRLPMRDPLTGGGYDGLHEGSVNQNQGAESTLAWLSTSQLHGSVAAAARG